MWLAVKAIGGGTCVGDEEKEACGFCFVWLVCKLVESYCYVYD